MTSKWPQTNQLNLKKNKLKGCANININDKNLDEILHIKNLYRELAMQNISNIQNVRSDTIQDIKVLSHNL